MLAESMLQRDLQQTENKLIKAIRALALLLVLVLVNPASISGQEKRAMEYFRQGKYSAVLDHYTKDFKSGLQPADVRLLSRSMLRLGYVADAIELAQRSYLDHASEPEIILALVEAFIYDGQYNAAYNLIDEIDDPEYTGDELYQLAKRAAVLKEWEKRESEYDVSPLNGFNTPKNEFSLFLRS